MWEGHQLRDFLFVEDAVDVLLAAAVNEAAAGRIFNVGGEPPISLNDLADLLVRVAGGGDFTRRDYPAERKRIDIGDYYTNFDLVTSVTGWRPRVTLEDGLRATMAFYRENLARYL